MGRKKKFPILENVLVEDMASEGKCIAKVDEKVIFIKNVAPGDIVDVRLTKNRKSFGEGQAIRFHKYSDLRENAFCQHYELCGGCTWQHVSYDSQLAYKQRQVKDALERIGKLTLPEIQPIIGAEKTTYYRNKLEFTFVSHRWLTNEEIQSGDDFERRALGFHIPGGFDKIVDIEHCHLQDDPSNQLRLAVRDYALEHDIPFYNLRSHEGNLRNLIIRTTNTGEVMVILQHAEDNPEVVNGLLQHIKDSFPEVTTVLSILNQKKNETYGDLEPSVFSGPGYITEEMEGLQFRIGPKSFFQTNSTQALNLYRATRDFCELTGDEVVYDLYTGTGTIANFVAKHAKKVIGVEYVPEAIEDAKLNSELNNITNTEFFAGDMKDVLNDEFIGTHGTPDVLITDPPRAGMHQDVVNTILRAKPKQIVYVSCNPATQARDLELMSEAYEVAKVQPVDMFPQTHHVENVVMLKRK